MNVFQYVFLLSLCISSLWGKSLSVEVSARSAILMNADTGAVLFEKQAYLPAYPASTTKIGTALFILDEKKPQLHRNAIVSEAALRMKTAALGADVAYALEPDGTMMGLKKGESLSIEALLHGIIMISGNDAANVIAECLSGSVSQFMHEMNNYLNRLGCQGTFYRNPHGLHHPEHVTTAYDLALMMKRGLSIPKFRELIGKVSYLRPKRNKNSQEELVTFNQCIKLGRYYDPRCIGGKTGYHSQSMATLVSAAEHQGRSLIAVLLGCSKTSRYEDAKRLFDAAFSEEKVSRLLLGPERVFSQKIEGGEGQLIACVQEPLQISYFPSEEPICRAFIHWHKSALPIKQGQIVGEVQVIDEKGNIMARASLVAKEPLHGTWSFRIKQLVHGIF
ncbi:MAG: D-alanyl-D-alanine carboxypeptidase [Chlamydiales bacterium]|nr:D-alanyl-D-alanine carboxypeptidase [Chlamydiales bacterium]